MKITNAFNFKSLFVPVPVLYSISKPGLAIASADACFKSIHGERAVIRGPFLPAIFSAYSATGLSHPQASLNNMPGNRTADTLTEQSCIKPIDVYNQLEIMKTIFHTVFTRLISMFFMPASGSSGRNKGQAMG